MKIRVTIEGTTPFMMHHPRSMNRKATGKKTIPSPQEEAKEALYWTSDKSSLMYPAENILRGFVTASRVYKSGKRSITPFVSGSLDVEPPEVSFHTKKYEIDTRRAIVQRQGILRSRPVLFPWELSFALVVSDDFPAEATDLLKAIAEECGRRVGLGDFRPEKSGRFGKFKVVGWEVET